MATIRIEFDLVASHADGTPVATAEWLEPLDTPAVGCVRFTRADGQKWSSGRVSFVPVELQPGRFEPSEALAADAEVRAHDIAGWVAQRAAALRTVQERGLKVFFLVNAWIDQDQFEWDVPAVLLVALGDAGVPLKVLTERG